MKRNCLACLFAGALLLVSCTTTKPSTAKIELTVNSDLMLQHSANLFAGEYYTSHITEKALPLTPAECPTLHFDSVDSRVTGYNGCNHYFCHYKLNGDKGITFNQPGSTMMACPNMDIETAFMQSLESVRTYEATEHGMLLRNEDGDVVLTLVHKEQK